MVWALFRGKKINFGQHNGPFPEMEPIHVADVASNLNHAGSFYVKNHIIRCDQYLKENTYLDVTVMRFAEEPVLIVEITFLKEK